MSRITLRERFFPLHQADAVDSFLDAFTWSAIFKAGTSDKTFDAWLAAQRMLEPRVDVAVGFIRLPEDRPASEQVSARSGIPHKSPQLLLFHQGSLRGHLDEFAIAPDRLDQLLRDHLPAEIGSPVQNAAVVTLDPYRRLLSAFVSGTLPDERFQWAYLDRLEKEALWRDDSTFDCVNGLFENPWGRELKAARLVAIEFQGQLAGTREALAVRAARLLERLSSKDAPG